MGADTPLDLVPGQSEEHAHGIDYCLAELPEQYEVLGKVSEGGMGAIFKAQNRHTNARVAIKVMRPGAAEKKNALERFRLEAKAASLLRHPHICQVHDFGLTTASKMPYLVMEWIDGVNLAAKVMEEKRLPAAQAVPIFQEIASALAHAHQHKVVHRDLKPENVMLKQGVQGRTEVQIVDFGIAKLVDDEDLDWQTSGLTRTGMVVGTPLFMSPEQARGHTIDGRADIYSFGCLMYFALTGKPPFVGGTVVDTINMHLNDTAPEFASALKVPADLKRIVFKSLEKDREDRYQTMEMLASDLKKLSKGVSLERRLLTTEKRSRRKNLIIALCFVAGFIATYLCSIVLQNWLDGSESGARTKTKHVQH